MAQKVFLPSNFHALCQGHLFQEAFPDIPYPWICLSLREGTIFPSLSYQDTQAVSGGLSGQQVLTEPLQGPALVQGPTMGHTSGDHSLSRTFLHAWLGLSLKITCHAVWSCVAHLLCAASLTSHPDSGAGEPAQAPHDLVSCVPWMEPRAGSQEVWGFFTQMTTGNRLHLPGP